ncbi:MAG: hypothetical protein SynsKO_41490 [Synoicihabitans sp.]
MTPLKRYAAPHIDELRKGKKPVLIPKTECPAAYLAGVEDFESLNLRMSILEGIAIGEPAIKSGRVKSQDETQKTHGEMAQVV